MLFLPDHGVHLQLQNMSLLWPNLRQKRPPKSIWEHWETVFHLELTCVVPGGTGQGRGQWIPPSLALLLPFIPATLVHSSLEMKAATEPRKEGQLWDATTMSATLSTNKLPFLMSWSGHGKSSSSENMPESKGQPTHIPKTGKKITVVIKRSMLIFFNYKRQTLHFLNLAL